MESLIISLSFIVFYFFMLLGECNIPIESNSLKCEVMDNQSPRSDGEVGMMQQSPVLDPNNPKHEAALKLQEVYKSFRTRRKLADGAVLVEQSWYVSFLFACSNTALLFMYLMCFYLVLTQLYVIL